MNTWEVSTQWFRYCVLPATTLVKILTLNIDFFFFPTTNTFLTVQRSTKAKQAIFNQLHVSTALQCGTLALQKHCESCIIAKSSFSNYYISDLFNLGPWRISSPLLIMQFDKIWVRCRIRWQVTRCQNCYDLWPYVAPVDMKRRGELSESKLF